jgi:hypothetical protein
MTLMRCLGCGMLVSPGPRCPSCQRAWTRLYDRTRPAYHALYQTPEWRRLSAEVRASAGRCTWCLKPTRRLVADHVVPVGPETTEAEFLDPSGLRPSCIPCNTRRGRNAKLPDLAAHEPQGRAHRDASSFSPAGRRPGAFHPTRTEGDLNV